MRFNLSTSRDGLYAKIEFLPDESLTETLTAADIEQLIHKLSDARGKMLPLVGQSESSLSTNDPVIDGFSPKLEFARLGPAPAPVAVAIAYPGLGWRTILLKPDEARQVGQRLLGIAGS
jgi:hypothetical protein